MAAEGLFGISSIFLHCLLPAILTATLQQAVPVSETGSAAGAALAMPTVVATNDGAASKPMRQPNQTAVLSPSAVVETVVNTTQTTLTTTTLTTSTVTSLTTTTSTSTLTITTTTTPICFEDDTAWAPLDMLGQNITKEADAFACQKRCLGVRGCAHFSYFKVDMDCHLQDAYAIKRENDPAFLSGPFHCWGAIPGQEKYVNLGSKTYVPKEIGCLQRGVLYSPIMGVPTFFPPEQGEEDLARGLNTIKKCQALCDSTGDCAHFSVQFPAGLCRMASTIARALMGLENTVSGDRNGCKVLAVAEALVKVDVADMAHIQESPTKVNSLGVAAGAILVAIFLTASAMIFIARWRPSACCAEDEADALLGDPAAEA